MTQDEFMELMAVRITVAQVKLEEQARKAHEVRVMRTAEHNGLSCIVKACFNKAEFISTNGQQMYCESHMLIGTAVL